MYKWLNYDLHMHSYASANTKTGDKKRVKEMSAKEYVDCLLGKVDVFSITDHNCFNSDFYDEIEKYIKDKPIKVIKGSELDVYVNETDFFQMGIYFEDDTSNSHIKEVIDELYKNNNKPKLGDIIQKMFSLKKRFLIMPEADKSKGISSIWRVLTRIGETDRFLFNGRYRVFNGYDTTDNFNVEGASQWALSYFKMTKEFEDITTGLNDEEKQNLTGQIVNKIKNEDFELSNDNAIKIYNIVKEYGQSFTYFSFSDWHNAEEYTNSKKNYVYGSMKYPFETLELAVLDPFSRIDVTTDEKRIPSHYIKNVSFKIKAKEYSIDFGTGLNSIVGKRASGKSLLVAVLQKLSDSGNKQLDKYADKGSKKNPWVPVDSIKCTLMDGTILKAGQLQSVGYIDQNSIKEIFDDPDNASEKIASYFPNLPEIDYNPLTKIIDLLKEISPFNKNFKSFTTYLNNDKNFSSYAFSEIKEVDYSKIKGYFINIKNNFDSIIKELSVLGFKIYKLHNLKKDSEQAEEYYSKLFELYNSLFSEINHKMKVLKNKSSSSQKEAEAIRKDYASSKDIIFNNFEKLLKAKKAIYLIDMFKLGIPDITLNRKSKYLFVSYYDIKENIKDILISNIQDTLKNTKSKNQKVLIEYLNETALLKVGQSNIWSKIDTKFISENLASKKSFFMVNQEFDLTKMKTIDDIQDKVQEGYLKDISNSSLGDQSSVYLELMLELEQSILLFDQPEDNVDNDYISNNFVPLLKNQKKSKQLIFVTHNPSVAVYTDSFNYIYATNDGGIEYTNYYIERLSDKEKVLDILDGGAKSFSNRNRKYGNIIGEYK